MEVVRRFKAKPARPLHRKRSGPSSDVQSSHRGAPPRPGPSTSSSSSVAPPLAAPQRDEVVRARERVCCVLCNFQAAQDRTTQQNATVDGAVLITQEKATHWDENMAIDASAVATISAALTSAAAREAAADRERRGAEAAVLKTVAFCRARTAQEVVAKEEAEVEVLEQALTEKRAQKEAEMKAQADAAKQKAIETARRKVAEEKAETKAELKVLEVAKARLQQHREREPACAH